MDIPDMVYASKIVLSSGRLAKIVKDMRQLDDTLRIRAAQNKAILSTHGDAGDLELHLKHNEDEVDDALNRTKIGTADGIMLDQQFALSYLDLFMKASCLSTFSTI